MAHEYSAQISRLKLVQEIRKSSGRDDLDQTEVDQLYAMVLRVADEVGDLLALIPMTFKQYTKHDLLHAKNLIDLMGRFIPHKTLKKLNGVELTVLALVAMLHDFGMYVEEGEKQRIVDSEEFQHLLEAMPERKEAIDQEVAAGHPFAANAIRDAVLADYFRKLHPERVEQNIRTYLPGVLRFREHDLTGDVARICASHGWGVFETTDPRHPEWTIEQLPVSDPIYGYPFNPQYLAICLRLSDIMDFDRSRTPLALLRTITDDKSGTEWRKHLAVRGWTINDQNVSFHARCDHPEQYVAVMEFLDWIDVELRGCRRLSQRQPSEIAERYLLHLPSAVDRFDVGMTDPTYVAGAFKFELDYERIMTLLMDRSLYPDPSLFLRELLQNSLDACRLRMALAQAEGLGAIYEPRITVWDNTSDPKDPTIVFQDNGTGMTRGVIEKYLMRVGRSYYRSTDFEIEQKRLRERGIEIEATSQFGIGFLSCFMVADRIEIETCRQPHAPLHLLIEGRTKHFTIREIAVVERSQFRFQGNSSNDDGPPRYPGTRVTLHMRVRLSASVEEVIDQFAVNIEVPVKVVSTAGEMEIPAWGWDLFRPSGTMLRAVQKTRLQTEVPLRLLEQLTALPIPLVNYEFCEGLHGALWFWMFQNEHGEPYPRMGHLEIRGNEIGVVGTPRRVATYLAWRGDGEQPLDVHQYKLWAAGMDRSSDEHYWREFDEVWDSIPAEIHGDVLAWLHAKPESFVEFVDWCSRESMIDALRLANWKWLHEAPTSFDGTIDLERLTELAIHGVSLPAGIVEWNPMQARSYAVPLTYEASGLVDVRSRVPRPSASRLFISLTDSDRIRGPLMRATLRFGLEQVRRDDPVWLTWFAATFRQFAAWGEEAVYGDAIRHERRLIHEVLRLTVVHGDAEVSATLSEAREQLGEWAMVSPHDDRPWIRLNTAGTLLLFGLPQRQRDGVEEIRLDGAEPDA